MLSPLGCDLDEATEGEVLVSVTLGPAGGSVRGGGIALVIPPGALTAETEIEFRRSLQNLSARDYQQIGDAVGLFPEGLILRRPAELTFTSDAAGSLFVQDGMTVAGGATAWINELAVVAPAQPGVPVVASSEPALGPSPAMAGALVQDVGHMVFDVTDLAAIPQFNISATLYDVAGHYERSLNGTGEGDCGFQLQQVVGGSLTAGCSEGPRSASIRLASARLEFDVVSFLAGKLDVPVLVGVVAGSEELAYQLGFFEFSTSACFQETCSGRGTCMPTADGGECVCDEGFGPGEEPFSCACIPQCDILARECGGDGCGGSCGDCADGFSCDNEPGLCVADGE